MKDILKILEDVKELAVRVGKFQAEQRKTFSRDSVETKHSHDYVSYVDKESEQMIVGRLAEILPEAGFVTEENTVEQGGDTELTWVVDPLDGTTNFIHDMGPWCVCIALRRKAELLMGVVYEVARKELFYATKGGGAWMENADGEVRRLRVSQAKAIDEALVVVGYPYNADDWRDFCMTLSGRLYGRCSSLRSLGSAEAELCYVAAGRVDVYFESFIREWDVCAGAAVIQEAGGRVSDYCGGDDLWMSGREVVATNGLLHEAIVDEMRNAINNPIK